MAERLDNNAIDEGQESVPSTEQVRAARFMNRRNRFSGRLAVVGVQERARVQRARRLNRSNAMPTLGSIHGLPRMERAARAIREEIPKDTVATLIQPVITKEDENRKIIGLTPAVLGSKRLASIFRTKLHGNLVIVREEPIVVDPKDGTLDDGIIAGTNRVVQEVAESRSIDPSKIFAVNVVTHESAEAQLDGLASEQLEESLVVLSPEQPTVPKTEWTTHAI